MKNMVLVVLLTMLCSFSSNKQMVFSKEYGFSIEVPEGYTFQKDYGEMVPLLIYSPIENDADKFRESINVTSEKFDGDADTYYQANLMGMNNVLKDFKPIENGRSTINGQPVHWLVYTFTYGEMSMKVLAYCFSFNARGYVVTCSASPESFSNYKPVFEKVAGTFKKM